jgi:hypothetical protein
MIKNLLTYLIITAAVVIFISCTESVTDNPIENQPPETHLFLYPDSGISQQKSKLHVHWWGDDSDGLVIGYIFKWQGISEEWSFTKSNDSIFALPIGTVDTSFSFLVAAVDNAGNGKYDEQLGLGNDETVSEPFTDLNGNGIYDANEPFIDLGAIDLSPAVQKFPIKNSSPEITWNDISILPEVSFPVMTLGWDAFDLDGNETITQIHLALNDTSEYSVLSGTTRLVSLIIDDLEASEPAMKIFTNADENKLLDEKLKNLRLDDFNRIYIRGVDNSGASSKFLPLPDTGRTWYVAKPKGELLIIDDYIGGKTAGDFYREKFNSFAADKFDELDIENTEFPYQNITFQNTIKLFEYVYWYSGSNPSLELTNLVTQNYIQSGGKIAFSMNFQDSSANFEFSTQVVQSFLPIETFDSKKPLSFLFPGANVIPATELGNLPTLETQSTIGFVRTFKVSEITAQSAYDLTSSQLNGNIALINKTKNLFFIGLPLHQCDANGNVSALLEQIFVNQFGLNL